jgi:hypothetical protein
MPVRPLGEKYRSTTCLIDMQSILLTERFVSTIKQFVLQDFKFAGDFSILEHSARLEGRHEHLGDSSGNLRRKDEY